MKPSVELVFATGFHPEDVALPRNRTIGRAAAGN